MRVMSPRWNRRDVLKGLLAASSAMFASKEAKSGAQLPEPQVEIQITPVSTCTFRLSILPLNNGSVGDIAMDGSLVKKSWGSPIAKLRAAPTRTISAGNLRLKISFEPVSIEVANLQGDVIQHLAWDENAGIFSFLNGSSPLFGLGEGGPQFDRRGSTDSMRRSEEHTSELQSLRHLVCRLLLEKKNNKLVQLFPVTLHGGVKAGHQSVVDR